MSAPSIIFFSVFVLPLVAFLIWLMRQDKRKGITGIIVVVILVVAGIVYTYLTREQANKQRIEQSGTAVPHKDS
ncbi:hypothetical protein [Mucilaginibacter sp.]|uniref:hypothetical protein n=1 Tax=Mucilaginibacter sp. TaxID=1882438 RepID=UPI002CE70F70|nr:hypothetical protein [Mucilaginibacter sp.]HTI61283.1 hypothetical protein [Mucilaginibacter sp.]